MKLFSFWRSLATYRVRIALNLKGITPDEVIDVNLMKGKQREDAFRKINPMMALPALIDGRRHGAVRVARHPRISRRDASQPAAAAEGCRRRARACAALAQIIACDTHPLIVPRVREYLAHEYKIDEPGVMKWGTPLAHEALEGAGDQSRRLQGRPALFTRATSSPSPTSASAGQAAGATYFKVDLAPFPTVKRIVDDLHARTTPSRAPIRSSSRARRAGVA